MKRVKYLWLFTSVILLFVIVCLSTISYNQYEKNRGYELALQYTLGNNTISVLKDGITNNDKILEKAIENKKISVGDANYLGNGFFEISKSSQDLFYMTSYTISQYKSNSKYNNLTAVISQELSLYISQLILKQQIETFILIDNPKLIPLTDENILKFKKMKEINNNWLKIIMQNTSTKAPFDIKDKSWERLAEGFSDYANELKWHTNEIFE